MAEWDAEREVSAGEVRAWLGEAGVVGGEPVLLGEGFDNFAFLSGDLVVRVPRRAMAVPDVRKEVELLRELQDLGLDVPRPVVVPDDVVTMEWPWFGYRSIAGEEMTEALVDGRDLAEVAWAVGRALRKLHDPVRADAVRSFVREDEYRRSDIAYRVEVGRKRVSELEERFGIDATSYEGLLREAEKVEQLPNVALVHGDTHFRHVFVDGTRPTGIIDWGDAHIGNPAVDLHVAWNFRPAERDAFFAAYGNVPEAQLLGSKLIALYINAVLALSASDFGLEKVEVAALQSLRRLSSV